MKTDDYALKSLLEEFFLSCTNANNQAHFYPYPLQNIYDQLNNIDLKKEDKECNNLAATLSKEIKNRFAKQESISMQFRSSGYIFQNLGSRIYDNNLISYTNSNTIKNFSYKFNLRSLDNGEYFFDNSNISLKHNNNIFKFGRIERWWSPSTESSMMLSNSARPPISLSISSYKNYHTNILKFLGPYDYEIFISRLERNRAISNALLFGNRISFSPSPNFKFSLIRIAQFGGKGRDLNTKTLKNMILGKDNTNQDLSFSEQPGNQLAGLDFSIKPFNKNIVFYGQILGEDGPDPINENIEFIKFPSKRFGQVGFFIAKKIDIGLIKITTEHLSTNSGYLNKVYNHELYKDGFRYFSKPIGANIDADSRLSTIKAEFIDNYSNIFSIKLTDYSINENGNINNKINTEHADFNELNINYTKKISQELDLIISTFFRSKSFENIKKNNIFIEVKYRF